MDESRQIDPAPTQSDRSTRLPLYACLLFFLSFLVIAPSLRFSVCGLRPILGFLTRHPSLFSLVSEGGLFCYFTLLIMMRTYANVTILIVFHAQSFLSRAQVIARR